MQTLKLLKKKVNLLILFAIALPFFSINFYLLKNLPANIGLACSIGAYFTPQNLIYSAIYGVLLAILIIGTVEIFRRKISSLNIASTGALSVTIVTLTTICTLCVLPALSLFGINLSLAVFTTYNFYFKIMALIILIFSILLIELNLRKSCLLSKCKIHV